MRTRSVRSVARTCAALAAAVVLLTPALATATPAMHSGHMQGDSSASAAGRPASAAAARQPVCNPLAIVALQQAELHASDPASPDQFGCVVAISGDTALIGAREKTVGDLDNAGAAYVFVRSGATWKFQQKLVASDPGDGDSFGETVALSGNTALIGAPAKTVTMNNTTYDVAGAAYVFVRSGTKWTQQTELNAPSPGTSNYFGSALALSGTTALVGASGTTVADQTPTDQPAAGAVYVYAVSGATWTEQTQLVASDPSTNAYFGAAVALSGDTALIGAPAGYQGSPHGAAYIFEGSGSSWTEQARFVAFDEAPSDAFGWAVALSGNTALIGAPGITVAGKEYAGAAYVFGGSPTGWLPRVELNASDPVGGDQFGCSLALSGTRALIGASGESDLGPMLPAQTRSAGGAGAQALGSHGAGGVAYVFDGSGAIWSQDRELTAADAAPYDCFGQSVALSGTTALIGACDKEFKGQAYAGAVYAESFATPTLTLKASLRTVTVGKTVTLKGVVKNFVSSAMTVRLWRKVGARMTALKTVKISSSGAFRWALTPKTAGKWVLVASYKAGGMTFKSKAVTVSARR